MVQVLKLEKFKKFPVTWVIILIIIIIIIIIIMGLIPSFFWLVTPSSLWLATDV